MPLARATLSSSSGGTKEGKIAKLVKIIKTTPQSSRFSDHGPSTGTTYSCVAIYEGTNVEIIANEQGSFTTPSFVSFTEKERLIGEAAKNNAAMNPRNTVFDAK